MGKEYINIENQNNILFDKWLFIIKISTITSLWLPLNFSDHVELQMEVRMPR